MLDEYARLIADLLESHDVIPHVHVALTGTRYIDFTAFLHTFQARVATHPDTHHIANWSIEGSDSFGRAISQIRRVVSDRDFANDFAARTESKLRAARRFVSPLHRDIVAARLKGAGGITRARATLARIEAALAVPSSHRGGVFGDARPRLRGRADDLRRLIADVERLDKLKGQDPSCTPTL